MHRDPDVVTVERFAARLRALTQEDWARLAESAAPLRGESIGAVWRRAEVEAVGASAGMSWARGPVQAAGLAAALLDELRPGLFTASPCISVRDVRRPGGRRYLELLADVQEVVEANLPADDGVAAAVSGAALALAHRHALSEGAVRDAYRYVEPVVPLATVLSEN